MRFVLAIAAVLLVGCGMGQPEPAPLVIDPVVRDPAALDKQHPAALTPLAIDSAGSRLHGLLYRAAGVGPHPTVVLLHGFPGTERNLDLAQAMRRAGFNVVFFHYRGAWGSAGDYSFANSLDDVDAVLAWLRGPEGTALAVDHQRLSLAGHSVGGFLALMTAADDPAVTCTVSIAGLNLGPLGALAASSPEAAGAVATGLDAGTGPLAGASGTSLRDELILRQADYDLLTAAESLAVRPLLLIGGRRDAVVPLEGNHDPLVAALQAAGATHLETALLDADHAFSSRRIALSRAVVEWLSGSCR